MPPSIANNKLLDVRAICDFISDLRKMENETISTNDIVSMIKIMVEI